jgi:hypothetical protein
MANTTCSIRKWVCAAFTYIFIGALLLGGLVSSSAAERANPVNRANASWYTTGRWEPAFSSGPIVHATVLPDGNLLHWSSFPPSPVDPGPFTRLWPCVLDSNGLCAPNTPSREDLYYTDTNVFCSGHSLMPDGRVMITGGTIYDGLDGDKRTTIFNYKDVPPVGQTTSTPWSSGPDMWEGRWYPTNVPLGTGGTLTIAGTYCTERGIGNRCVPGTFVNNPYPEILHSPTATAWDKLEDANLVLPLYPWLYYASNGKVFYAGPTEQSRWLNIQGEGSWSDGPTSSVYRESGSSVMYDTDKVMIAGGGVPNPVDTVELIDLSAPTPAWRGPNDLINPVAPMAFPRKHHNLTILADGTVLATGGTKGPGFNNNCVTNIVFAAERWNPVNETWSTMASMTHNRRYHSVAMLLIDGRVMVGGSDAYPSEGDTCKLLDPVYQTEIFTPPYLFNSDGSYAARPVIQTAPEIISYGSQFVVGTTATDAPRIAKITMVRLSSVTHSKNMNQRINHLTFQRVGNNLNINAPAGSNVAPPGHYMVFIITNTGVPSVGKVVRIQ